MNYEKYQETIYSIILGVAIFLFILSLNRFITMIFVLNFSTSGLNASILFVLLFFNFPYLLIVKQFSRPREMVVFVHWVVLLLASSLMIIQQAIIATIISAIVLCLATYLILIYQTLKSGTVRLGILLGLIFTVVQYTVFSGTNLFATRLGNILYIIILLLTAIILVYTKPVNLSSITQTRTKSPITLLTLFSIFLGAPFVIASWTYPSKIGAEILGITFPFFILLTNLSVVSSLWMVWAFYDKLIEVPNLDYFVLVIVLFGFGDVIWFSLIPTISVFFTIICLIFLVFLSIEQKVSEINIWEIFAIQFALILLIFLHVSAGNWAFLPNLIGSITRGNAGLFLYLFMIILVLVYIIERRFKNEK